MRSRLGIAACSPATTSRAVEVLAAVAVAVDREEDLGLDLGEAVDDAARRRSRASSSTRSAPMRGGGEEGDDRLGDVRHVGDDAVAAARRPSARRPAATRGDLRAQLAPAQLAELAQLGGVQDRRRRRRRLPREDVLGVVELGARRTSSAPGIARRPRTRAYGRRRPATSKKSQIDAQKPSRSSTDQLPERLVVVEARGRARPRASACSAVMRGALDALRRRLPEELAPAGVRAWPSSIGRLYHRASRRPTSRSSARTSSRAKPWARSSASGSMRSGMSSAGGSAAGGARRRSRQRDGRARGIPRGGPAGRRSRSPRPAGVASERSPFSRSAVAIASQSSISARVHAEADRQALAGLVAHRAPTRPRRG